MSDILDEQEFYELMQTYRHTPTTNQQKVVDAYEAVKGFIRDNRDSIELQATRSQQQGQLGILILNQRRHG